MIWVEVRSLAANLSSRALALSVIAARQGPPFRHDQTSMPGLGCKKVDQAQLHGCATNHHQLLLARLAFQTYLMELLMVAREAEAALDGMSHLFHWKVQVEAQIEEALSPHHH